MSLIADRCAPFYSGGYERHLWELARRLAMSHEVYVFTSLGRHYLEKENVNFVRIAPYIKYTGRDGSHSLLKSGIFALSSMIELPNQHNFDFVDVLGIPYLHIPTLRIRESFEDWKWGITVWEVWWNYSYLSGWLSSVVSRKLFRYAMSLSTHGNHLIITGSYNAKQSLERFFNVDSSRIVVNSPGIDVEEISKAGVNEDVLDVAFLGYLNKTKRVDDIIRAVGILKDQIPSIKVAIIGKGPKLNYLKELVSNLDVAGKVTFYGELDGVNKYCLLKGSKTFVMPSEREGFSISTLEAMACGCVPIVAEPKEHEAFGVSDFVIDGLNGIWYPCGRIDILASEIRKLLEDEPLRKRMSISAIETSKFYDWKGVVRNYEHKVLNSN